MQFVAPEDLRAFAENNGLRQISSATRQTRSGKQFEVQVFQADSFAPGFQGCVLPG